MKPVEVNIKTSENHRFFMFPVDARENIDPKCVKQQKYWRERHNFMFLAWNVSSSIVKQNDCKNKTWL